MVTVIVSVPSTAISLAGIAAVSCVALTKVVVLLESLNCTTELERKFVPFTVNVNVVSPAVLLIGKMLVVVGTGLIIEAVFVHVAVQLPTVDVTVNV